MKTNPTLLLSTLFILGFAFLSYPSPTSHRVFESVVSTLRSARNLAQVSSDTFPPSVPDRLTAKITGNNELTIYWNPSFDRGGIGGYKVYKNNTVVSDTFREFYVDKNLTPETSYTYTISAYDRAGNTSNQSNYVTYKITGGTVSSSPSTPTGETFSKNLRYGQENSDILALQNKLKSLGYLSASVTPNGYFGRQTLTAVIKYQRAQGLSTTGFVGPLTRASLSGTIPSSTIVTSSGQSAVLVASGSTTGNTQSTVASTVPSIPSTPTVVQPPVVVTPTPTPTPSNPLPTLTFTASPTSVTSGSASTLTWVSTNTTSCTASGAWTGSKATSGSASTGALTSASNTFTLTCTGAGGTAVGTAIVSTTANTPPPVVVTPNPVQPTPGSVAVQLYRYTGSGQVQFSNGFPLQQGKLQPSQIGNVALFLNGVEQPIFVKALGGTFPDGSLRSILIQGLVTGPSAGSAIQGFIAFGTPRTTAPVSEVPPPTTLDAALLATSATYLVSTKVAGPQLTDAQVQASTADIQGMNTDFKVMAPKIIANFGGIKTPRNVSDYEHVLTHYQFYIQTADPYWYDIAWRMGDSERLYVEANFAPEWLINPEGVAIHYWMGGDERSRVAVSKMATWSVGGTEYIYRWDVPEGGYRFKARSLIGALACLKIGCTMGKDGYTYPYTNIYNLQQILPTIITKLKTVQDPSGKFPGTSYNGEQKNYMVGMMLTALTQYYDEFNQDPAVLSMIKKSLDYMWTTQWVPSGKGFYYCSLPNVGDCGNMPIVQSAGLNNLILPAYAWYYNKTKDPAYLTMADDIFAGNRPNRANWLGFVKQFDEGFYRVANYYYLRQ